MFICVLTTASGRKSLKKSRIKLRYKGQEKVWKYPGKILEKKFHGGPGQDINILEKTPKKIPGKNLEKKSRNILEKSWKKNLEKKVKKMDIKSLKETYGKTTRSRVRDGDIYYYDLDITKSRISHIPGAIAIKLPATPQDRNAHIMITQGHGFEDDQGQGWVRVPYQWHDKGSQRWNIGEIVLDYELLFLILIKHDV